MPKASFELQTKTQLLLGVAAVAAFAAGVRYYHYQQYETVEFGHRTKGGGIDRRGVERDAGRVENDGLRNMQIFVLRALKKSKQLPKD